MDRSALQSAMILAAGFGTRMRPLTDDRPKPMVALSGKPMIDHVLVRLEGLGIERAVINLHYKSEILKSHLGTRPNSLQIAYSPEQDEILDTGGGIKQALPLLGTNPFLLHNSDSVWLEHGIDNLARLIAHYDPDKMDSLLLMAQTKTAIGYDGMGDFFIEAGGHLRRRAPDEQSPNVYMGVSIIHPRLFEDSPEGVFSINPLWNRAIENGRVYGLPFEGTWMHVGDPQAVKDAEEVMASHG